MDLAALQLSGTHILKKRKRLGRSKYKVRTVQGSCVTCTEVGEGDSFSKRRFCASHRTAEENISSLTRVVEICPPTIYPLHLKAARAYVELSGVPMIQANRQAFR